MLIRSIIIYFCVLLVVRLMGKRQIGEMQPFEFVITLIIWLNLLFHLFMELFQSLRF